MEPCVHTHTEDTSAFKNASVKYQECTHSHLSPSIVMVMAIRVVVVTLAMVATVLVAAYDAASLVQNTVKPMKIMKTFL